MLARSGKTISVATSFPQRAVAIAAAAVAVVSAPRVCLALDAPAPAAVDSSGESGGEIEAVAPTAPLAPVAPDHASTEEPASHRAIDRTWLYLDDARTPAQWQVVGTTSFAYTTVGSNPDRAASPYRAFAFNTAQPGALLSLGAEVGLLPWLSLDTLGQVNAGGAASAASPGAIVGLRARVTPESWKSVSVVASGGYVRETWAGPTKGDETGEFTGAQPHGDNGAWAQAAVTADIQRLRLGFTAHGEHVFADGRDAVDVMLKAGVNYRVVEWFRAGVEWVGQDLEESFGDGAEGGARHFVGPTASVQLLRDRLTIVGGPSVGLSSTSPQFLGRLALAYGF